MIPTVSVREGRAVLTEASMLIAGHTGGGPGSVIAVYHGPASRRTAAAFSPGDDQGLVEQSAAALLI